MQLVRQKNIVLPFLVLSVLGAHAQHKPLRVYTPIAPKETTLVPVIDSVPTSRPADPPVTSDTLAWQQLQRLTGYAQLDRLVQQLPVSSACLNQLPSVLPVAMPLSAFKISSGFGMRRHPVLGETRFHGGVDVRAPLGMIVKATAPGRVMQTGYAPGLGAFVRIAHGFGFETIYGHLSGYCVRPGDSVSRYQQIGLVGRSGLTTGPHLHYVIKKNGSAVDPFFFCFLLRRRLYLAHSVKPTGSGARPGVANTVFSVR